MVRINKIKCDNCTTELDEQYFELTKFKPLELDNNTNSDTMPLEDFPEWHYCSEKCLLEHNRE